MLTQTQEDYVRSIYLFYIRNNRFPQIKEIAENLNKGKSTVSERLQDLAKLGIVKKARYSNLELTKEGNQIAEKLTWKHRVIEIFLFDILDFDLNQIHQEAHKLEHAFSDEATMRLYKFLKIHTKKDLVKDPHGQYLPEISY